MFQDPVSYTLGEDAEVTNFFDGLQAHLQIGWDLHVEHWHERQNLKSVDHIPHLFHWSSNDYCEDDIHYHAKGHRAVDNPKSLLNRAHQC